MSNEKKTEQKKPENRGIMERNEDYKRTLQRTRDPRAAVRAYCAGNKWATENAKAVGNW